MIFFKRKKARAIIVKCGDCPKGVLTTEKGLYKDYFPKIKVDKKNPVSLVCRECMIKARGG